MFLAQWTSDAFLILAGIVMFGIAAQRAGNWQTVARRPIPDCSCKGNIFYLRSLREHFVCKELSKCSQCMPGPLSEG